MTQHHPGQFTKNKIYAIINVSGIMMGIAVTIFISTWIADEISIKRKNNQSNSTIISNQPISQTKKQQNNVPIHIAEGLRISFGRSFELVVFSPIKENELLNTRDKKICCKDIALSTVRNF